MSKFRRHVSQKRKITHQYDRTIYKTVLIFRLFVEDVIEVASEAEIWMIESGVGNPQLHIWRGKEEGD
jgi:hypothetical protein